jgi:hypothetical protein
VIGWPHLLVSWTALSPICTRGRATAPAHAMIEAEASGQTQQRRSPQRWPDLTRTTIRSDNLIYD